MTELSALQLSALTGTFLRCRNSVRRRQLEAEIPQGYMNFEFAVGILNAALEALLSQTWDTALAARNVRVAHRALQEWNAGPAAPAVTLVLRELEAMAENYPLQAT